MNLLGIVCGVLTLILAAVDLLGWVVPLASGLRRRRRGEPSRGLLLISGLWVALAAVMIAVYMPLSEAIGRDQTKYGAWFGAPRPLSFVMVLGLFFLFLVVSPLLLGWLAPLWVGVRRRRRGGRGTALIGLACLWMMLCVAGATKLTLFYREQTRVWRILSFDPATYPADQKGAIKIDWPGQGSLYLKMLEGEGYAFELKSDAVNIPAPVGSYLLDMGFNLYGLDATGAQWMAGIRSDTPRTLTIRRGEVTDLAGGPPFTVMVDVSGSTATNAVFDLKIRDALGNRVSMAILETGRDSTRRLTRRPAQFEVLAPDGGVIWRGGFEYG